MVLPPRLQTLFFALLPDAAACVAMRGAAEDVVAAQGSRERLIGAVRYHVTLHFLGRFESLPDGLVGAARAAADDVACPRFDLAFDRAGSFSAAQPPWVLLASRPPEALLALWRSLGEALARGGVALPAGTRRFVPHVTFAYGRRALPETAVAPIAWSVAEFALLAHRAGEARHEVLGRWPASA
jgi:2'-5' RNA ligase